MSDEKNLFERRKKSEKKDDKNSCAQFLCHGLSSTDRNWNEKASWTWAANDIQSIGERRKPSDMPYYTSSEKGACRLSFDEENIAQFQ